MNTAKPVVSFDNVDIVFGANPELTDFVLFQSCQKMTDRIGKYQWLRDKSQVGGFQFVPVFRVVIPTAPRRFVVLHKHAKTFAHLAVERFHPAMPAALKIVGNFIEWKEKVLRIILLNVNVLRQNALAAAAGGIHRVAGIRSGGCRSGCRGC